jgi:tyrosinase
MTVSLGPFDKTVPNLPNNPRSDGYGHNPRCLKRDVNKYAAAVTTTNYSYALITQNPSIDAFQNILLGTPGEKRLGRAYWGTLHYWW